MNSLFLAMIYIVLFLVLTATINIHNHPNKCVAEWFFGCSLQ